MCVHKLLKCNFIAYMKISHHIIIRISTAQQTRYTFIEDAILSYQTIPHKSILFPQSHNRPFKSILSLQLRDYLRTLAKDWRTHKDTYRTCLQRLKRHRHVAQFLSALLLTIASCTRCYLNTEPPGQRCLSKIL